MSVNLMTNKTLIKEQGRVVSNSFNAYLLPLYKVEVVCVCVGLFQYHGIGFDLILMIQYISSRVPTWRSVLKPSFACILTDPFRR